MEWIGHILRDNPSLAVFLTLGIGFFIGQLKYKSFSLGTVTSVLLVGVLVGQFDIPVPGPLKDVFFLLFLFSIGYSVGPQFFRALKGDGIKQVLFAVVVCGLCLLSVWGVALCMGYNIGEAVGLLAGSQTMSAVIGVGTDTINSLGVSEAEKQQWISIIPVCYAVTYVFGTIGSAYILANLGPWLLGGLKKVKAETAELEKKMNYGTANTDPNYIKAMRPVVFRAYKVTDSFFATPRTIDETEDYFRQKGKTIYVERLRSGDTVTDVVPGNDLRITLGDEIVLSGRREFIVGHRADAHRRRRELDRSRGFRFRPCRFHGRGTRNHGGFERIRLDDCRRASSSEVHVWSLDKKHIAQRSQCPGAGSGQDRARRRGDGRWAWP